MIDKNVNAFILHVAFFALKMSIYPSWTTHISLFIVEKVIIPKRYADFANMPLKKLAKRLSKQISINKYTIQLKNSKQLLSYRLIYNLKLVELEIFKTYIKTNLANNFFQLFKLSADISILFFQKNNNSLYLYINYWRLNNLIIKN